jgi:hypothetical protein
VGVADAKIADFLQRLGAPSPTPMQFLKFATGFGEGIDGGRDLLVALLPPVAGSHGYRPLVLLPTDDYEKLAASVRGDASGEICRVTISGEDVLIARNRDYALLMNVEHRATMTRMLAREPQLLESARLLGAWLVDNDLAVVASPPGMKALFALGREGLNRSQRPFDRNRERVPMGALMTQVRQMLGIYRTVLDAADAQVESSALGVSIDLQSHVTVSARMILSKRSEFARFRFAPSARRQWVMDETTGACVAAMVGSIPKGWEDQIAKTGRRLLQRFPDLEGYGDFGQTDWDKVERSYRAAIAGIRSVSLTMRVAREDEPLLSSFYGVLEVEDASRYLASYQQSLALNNELVERSTSDIKLISKWAPVTVADWKGIRVVADIATAAGDRNNPFWQAILSNLFGKDGKMKTHLLAIDKTHVVISTAEEENLVRFVRGFQSGGLPNQPVRTEDVSLPTTLQWIGEDSSWVAIVSPHGAVQWITRWMKTLMDQFGQTPQIPPFRATPPIGLSFSLAEGRCAIDMVLPWDALTGLAEFIQAVR